MTEPVAVEGAPARDPDSSVAPPGTGAAGAMPTAKETGVDGAVGGGSPEGVTAQEEPHVSWQDIKSVQNLIERCLQKFMTQTEIIAALQVSNTVEVEVPRRDASQRCGVCSCRFRCSRRGGVRTVFCFFFT